MGLSASSGELFRSLADRTKDQLGVESEGKSSRCCQTFCPKQLDKCGFYLLSLKLLSRGVSKQFGDGYTVEELGLKHPSPFVRDHPIVYQKKDILIEKILFLFPCNFAYILVFSLHSVFFLFSSNLHTLKFRNA